MDFSNLYSNSGTPPVANDGADALVGLLGGILADIGDPSLTRSVLMDRLAGHLSADAWLWSVLHLEPGASAPRIVPVVAESSTGSCGCPLPWEGGCELEFARFVGRVLSTRSAVACSCGCGSFVSLHPFPQAGSVSGGAGLGICGCIVLHRQQGRPPFTLGEIRPIHDLLSVLDRLHIADWIPSAPAPSDEGLPPRPREVFALLLGGHPRKEIADTLGLSLNTVHGYVRDIFRYFGVNSHAELVARFARQRREGEK